MTVKKERFESLLKKELAQVIIHDLNDPNLEFATLTDVELSNDLSYATLYVSFLDEDKREKGLEALEKAKGLLRSKIASVMNTRRTPEVIISYDESLVRGAKIDAILAKLKDKE